VTPYADAPEGDGSDGDEPPTGGGDDSYAKAGRTIRHAIADGDDGALAQAICDLVDIHNSAEPEEEKPKGKPNLAALLLMKRKK